MQNVKGTYDYRGAEQALRRKVQRDLERMFELYDFDSMETPALNEKALLASKYAGGDEILREMYSLSDQGKRELALRYDLTIPFAKVAAMNPGMELPFKRYEIGKVFRDGPVKHGRLREFTQCDADVVGIAGPEAEAELIQLASDAFGRLDIDIVIRWNNRRFLGEILSSIGIPENELLSVMLTLDKLAKIGIAGVTNELLDKGLGAAAGEAVLELIGLDEPTYEAIARKYGLADSGGAVEVEALQAILDKTGLAGTCVFDPFLSRGLSFYTGTVYEIFDASGAYPSSLGSGGRYDAIIGKLVGREDVNYPAVGISFGIESIMELLKARGLPEPDAAVLVVPIGDALSEALAATAKLRQAGIRTRLDGSRRKLKKLLASAAAKGTRFVILIGEAEASRGMVRLKDMAYATEDEMVMDAAVAIIEKWTL
ncbi:histidine--tRNA ligase [Paenibacillus hamazuiensis]|uniref:histidine--tRNA ligase n=1 Tax=Paenibacillus hamazuiensis TaxID=2936508 RepID=UPI00200D5E34|nr:histidine--tRNA ligase [Paenibacillus hamazuiensis]